VPFWSWMAYNGGIDFVLDAPLIVLDSKDLRFNTNKKALIIKVRYFKHCRLEQKGKEHAIFTKAGRVGSLWFNIWTNN